MDQENLSYVQNGYGSGSIFKRSDCNSTKDQVWGKISWLSLEEKSRANKQKNEGKQWQIDKGTATHFLLKQFGPVIS